MFGQCNKYVIVKKTVSSIDDVACAVLDIEGAQRPTKSWNGPFLQVNE